MIHIIKPDDLIKKCLDLEKKGFFGCLISGGSSSNGTIPWEEFIDSIRYVKKNTNLHISIHSGIIDSGTAKKLKKAGVDQALIDVIGDNDTLKKIYHCDFKIDKIEQSLKALNNAMIPIVPHIVVGLHYGKIIGEYNAIQIIKNYSPEVINIVGIMRIKNTPMENIILPSPEDIIKIIATAKIEMPDIPVALGCARDRSDSRIDVLAVECGVNRIALPSDEAIEKAKEYRLEINWEKTCCSISKNKNG
jgi:uncharacterized radical SAM superfamily protein